MNRLAVWVAAVSVLGAPAAFAEPLVVEVGQSTYHYGEKLTVVITVESLADSFALLQIRDSQGTSSSPLQIPLTQLQTALPSQFPFDRETYPAGEYFVDVAYSGFEATASFVLVDTGNIVVPNWIKQVAFYWVSGEISGANYADTLLYLVEQGMITVPEVDGGEPDIPPWVAHATVWWLRDEITDEAYILLLQYLLDNMVMIL